MTGDFKVNVDKLIRHHCPTLADKELKWVHQLDFGEFFSARVQARCLRLKPLLAGVVLTLCVPLPHPPVSLLHAYPVLGNLAGAPVGIINDTSRWRVCRATSC